MFRLTIITKIKKYLRSTLGNAAVEFALILPILLLFVVPTLDFGLVAYNKIKVRIAMNTGLSSAMETTSVTSIIQSAVQDATTLENPTINVTKYCQCSDNVTNTCTTLCPDDTYPDTYYDISVDASVGLYGKYGFIDNPYPISENIIVMVP